MVVSSKKKRGQQRKAIKNEDAAAKAIGAAFLSRTVNSQDIENLFAKLSKDIEKCNDAATRSISEYWSTTLNPQLRNELNMRVMPHVLKFLKRCEDETFASVLASVGGDIGKKLKCPSTWIVVLESFVKSFDKSLQLQIAESIGPLVKCMCNDTERIFFKSNKHWKEGILPFVQLIYNLMFGTSIFSTDKKGTDKKVVDVLLNYEGLLSSIVQWGYWGRQSDFTKKLKDKRVVPIMCIGRDIIGKLVTTADEDRHLLEVIGSTPTESKDYDPNCMISFVVGLIRDHKEGAPRPIDPFVTSIIQPLIEIGDCIDKDVITEMIDLGMNHVHDNYSAVVVAKLTAVMLRKGTDNKLCDTRVAFAIRSGLIEMCLDFIERHGSGRKVDIQAIFRNIYTITLHPKTAKAIRSKKVVIEERLVECLEKKVVVTSNAQSKKLLDMVRSIIDISDIFCCRCNKSLSRTEVMECNGCHRMSYCSRACQKKDWLNGHNLACCSRPTNETAGHFQGRYIPEESPSDERAAAKLENLEINSTMLHLKIFLDNSDIILRQASAIGLPLCDCVVHFGLCLHNCPLTTTVEVESYTESFESHDAIEGYEKSRSRDNIMCVYHSSMFIIGDSEDELSMQRFFPHEWLTKKKKNSFHMSG